MPRREPVSPAALVREHPWPVAMVVAVVVALALVTLLGGWARSTPPGVAQVAPGTEVEAAPFRIRLDAASAQYVLDGTDAEPEQAFVVVEGQVELTAPASVSATRLTRAFTADLSDSYDPFGSPVDEPEASITVAADGSRLQGIGPGLTYDVRVTFIVAEESVPERLTVTLLEHTERSSPLDGKLDWYDPAPVARTTLDVAPLPATRPEPEGF